MGDAHMQFGRSSFWGPFWLLALLLAGAVAWFLGNLLYTPFWTELGRRGFPITEAQMIGYIGAHLVPFFCVLAFAGLLSLLIRNGVATAGAPVGMRVRSVALPEEAPPKLIEINYGEDAPFERLTSTTTSRLNRMLLIEFKNA